MKTHHYAFTLLCKNHSLKIYKKNHPKTSLKEIWGLMAKDWKLACVQGLESFMENALRADLEKEKLEISTYF